MASKPWKTTRIQKRWLETRGYVVDYYDNPPKFGKEKKPNGSFDLRDVTMLGCAHARTGLGHQSLAPAGLRS